MVKLIKYEFVLRGKRMMIFLIAAFLLNMSLYLYMRFGTDLIESMRVGFTLTLLIILFITFFALLFIDVLTAFNRELTSKEGYMIFLTPRSGWQIIGGKLLSGLLEGFSFLLFFLLLAYVDFFVFYKNTVSGLVLESLEEFLGFTPSQQTSVVVTFIIFTLLIIISVINTVVTAYTAMTLRRGFFAHVRFGAFLAGVVFVVISVIVGRLNLLVMDLFPGPSLMELLDATYRLDFFEMLDKVLLIYTLTLTVFTALIFAGAGYILEKKVDL
ncbi:MAG: hypothetical protein LBL37_03860 [Gracilibacteraceae bacterium]|nr:hypothetical protein [Gracilibacteraceae bacterium]